MVSFYILFLAQCIGSTITLPLNIQSIKNNLNKILHTNGDIHIITLTRNFGKKTESSYDGFSLFPISKLELLNQKLSTYLKKEEEDLKHANKKRKLETSPSEKQIYLSENGLKIIIFNEYFFKKITPLTKKEFEDILTKIKDISQNSVHKKTIFYVNFLHQEEIDPRSGPTKEQAEIIAKNRKNYSHNQNFANYDCFPWISF